MLLSKQPGIIMHACMQFYFHDFIKTCHVFSITEYIIFLFASFSILCHFFCRSLRFNSFTFLLFLKIFRMFSVVSSLYFKKICMMSFEILVMLKFQWYFEASTKLGKIIG